ncbi:hypothetical protein RAS1_02320 [Phycisphaerae bacterium RAS1]|nr:hypothetical protein RAS1_02320 [Phycisphaerae bacterium RAS1]
MASVQRKARCLRTVQSLALVWYPYPATSAPSPETPVANVMFVPGADPSSVMPVLWRQRNGR